MENSEKPKRAHKAPALELVVAGLLAALIMVLAIPLITRTSGDATTPTKVSEPAKR